MRILNEIKVVLETTLDYPTTTLERLFSFLKFPLIATFGLVTDNFAVFAKNTILCLTMF